MTTWLSRTSAPPKPVMTFDNVEAIKSLVAVGLGASVVPRLCLGDGHVPAGDAIVVPLSPRAGRRVGLVKLRGERATKRHAACLGGANDVAPRRRRTRRIMAPFGYATASAGCLLMARSRHRGLTA